MREFLVALNARFTSIIEKGLAVTPAVRLPLEDVSDLIGVWEGVFVKPRSKPFCRPHFKKEKL